MANYLLISMSAVVLDCLSPSIFNVFMNMFITKLKLLDAGCRIGFTYIGCVLYADDIILLSPSVCGLQKMIGATILRVNCL